MTYFDRVRNLFKDCGFDKIQIRSIRGIGYCKEDAVYSLEVRESAIDEGFTEENEYFKNDYADLVGLYVRPEYQGMGVGTMLKDIFTHWAKENKADGSRIS